jgi:hypothetical protein
MFRSYSGCFLKLETHPLNCSNPQRINAKFPGGVGQSQYVLRRHVDISQNSGGQQGCSVLRNIENQGLLW